jgi:hypothetical protein
MLVGARKAKVRGVPIPISEGYWSMLRQAVRDEQERRKAAMARGEDVLLLTEAQLGREISGQLGVDVGLSNSAVNRWMSGEQATDTVTRGVCLLLGFEYPIMSADSPEDVEWFRVGRVLREWGREDFDQLLADAKPLAAAAVARRRRLKKRAH